MLMGASFLDIGRATPTSIVTKEKTSAASVSINYPQNLASPSTVTSFYWASDCHRNSGPYNEWLEEHYNPMLGSCEMDGVDRCLLNEYVCDGVENCDDGSDEAFCDEGGFELSNWSAVETLRMKK